MISPVGSSGNEGYVVQRGWAGCLERVLHPSEQEGEGPRWRGPGEGGEVEAGEGSVSPGGAGQLYPLLWRGQRWVVTVKEPGCDNFEKTSLALREGFLCEVKGDSRLLA